MTHQQAEISWRDGKTPVSDRFDDPYYSLENGLDETRHTFLAGNGLPERFRDGFHVAELGFGTGLNFLATCAAWSAWAPCADAAPQGRLYYTSFEAYPMSATDMAQALNAFPDLPGRGGLLTAWARGHFPAVLGSVTLDIRLGDARDTLPQWDQRADAWYLDGFAPARNPELWEPALMQQVAQHTAAQGSFATYTAAGEVRRALTQAGFDVTRQPGYGRKRHMTVGRLP